MKTSGGETKYPRTVREFTVEEKKDKKYLK
jgi:hypothetical protein